ncbi:MAG: pyrroline-5-carboxylate reductase [Desulfosalsimonas sp.]
MEEYQKIGFIGAGNMAEAMIGAILRAGVRQPQDIMISDPDSGRKNEIAGRYHVTSASTNSEIADSCEIIILAVKPQIMDEMLNELSGSGCFGKISRRRLFVSIAAGISLSRLERIIYANCSDQEKAAMPVIRVMPNTPALVGAGVSGVCANPNATEKDIEQATAILSSMGEVFVFDEEKMDAVTAVSGSGPAYGFYLVEAMTEAGIKLGLKRSEALKLAQGAISGAIALIRHENEAPEVLRSKVTSPGGTTEAAISRLEDNNVKDLVVEAVLAAAKRSRELSSSQDA